MAKRVHHYPADLKRDHARPRTAPAPTTAAMEARLTELVRPATLALVETYRQLGLRGRLLTLPVMVTVVVTLIWRQVPAVSQLASLLARAPLLWEPPRQVSQQALSLRLRVLPATLFADLFHTLLPTLQARAAARTRPRPAALTAALAHYERVWALDVTTLEALFRKVGLLRPNGASTPPPLGGRLCVLLDLVTKLPIQLWYDEDPSRNEKTFLDRVLPVLTAGTLLVLDRGFYSFALFDWLTEHAVPFVTRARATVVIQSVEQVLVDTPRVRDRIVRVGQRKHPCRHPLRLVEVLVGTTWHGYLTNELAPQRLSPQAVVALYGQRWRIEEAFLLVKRLLGLSYLWTGAINGITLQLWATWLLYAVLVDLSDAVAQELAQPLERISLEMVYRGLFFFALAVEQGQATDPVQYLADPAQADLHLVKRRRPARERARAARDDPFQDLNL